MHLTALTSAAKITEIVTLVALPIPDSLFRVLVAGIVEPEKTKKAFAMADPKDKPPQ
jgi:hypothetical protein